MATRVSSPPRQPLPILGELENLRQRNVKMEKMRSVQPDLQEQRHMVIKAFARKFVKTNIAYELEVLQDKLALGDERLLNKSKNKPTMRPFTAPVDGRDFLGGTNNLDNNNNDDVNINNNSNTSNNNSKSNDKRPNTTKDGKSKSSQSPKRGSNMTRTSSFLSEKDKMNARQPVLEELNFPSILFNSLVTKNKLFQHSKVFRNAPPMEVEVERPPDIQVEDLKSVPKKKRVGMAILVDPSINTNGKDVILRVTYDVNLREPVPGATSLFDKSVEKPIRYVTLFSIRGSGNVFGLKITQSVAEPFYGEHKVGPVPHVLQTQLNTGTSLLPEEPPVVASRDSKHVIPGWQGLSPLFIPYHVAKFELLEATDLPLNSVSLGVFMCTNLSSYYKNVRNYIISFTMTRASNKTLDGGIPTLHMAAWKGDIQQLNLLLSQGANIDGRSRENRTSVLHEAIAGGHVAVVNTLLMRGANQLIADDSGNVPLHLACQLGNIAIAIILMKDLGGKKALQVYNKKGMRPLDLCQSKFLQQRVEDFMRAYLIVIKQRVSVTVTDR